MVQLLFTEIFLCGVQKNQVTYALPTFPKSVRIHLLQKTRAVFLPGTANRTAVIDCLFDDLIRRKIWYYVHIICNVIFEMSYPGACYCAIF
jgi:hypothetical protein